MLETNDLQDIIYTSMDDGINVTINNLYLFLPNLIPSVETQLMFNEAKIIKRHLSMNGIQKDE